MAEVPTLSDAKAREKAVELVGWIEKAYIVGMNQQLIEYLACNLQQAYTQGAMAGANHFAAELKRQLG